MEELRDKCAVCGKEVIITDPNMIANLKTCKGKSKATKVYCSEECRKKDSKPIIEGSLDVSSLFS